LLSVFKITDAVGLRRNERSEEVKNRGEEVMVGVQWWDEEFVDWENVTASETMAGAGSTMPSEVESDGPSTIPTMLPSSAPTKHLAVTYEKYSGHWPSGKVFRIEIIFDSTPQNQT